VLELEDLEDRALDLDVVAVLELIGVDDGRSALLKAKIAVSFAYRQACPAARSR
jgi:hypothetical protein